MKAVIDNAIPYIKGVLEPYAEVLYREGIAFRREDVAAVPEIKILAESEEAGLYAMATKHGKQVFITGHSEYDWDTLNREYVRDKNAGLPIEVPKNYFPDDDDSKEPLVRWRGHANLLYTNWLNYFVYQSTPFEVKAIGRGERCEDQNEAEE